MSYSTLTSKTNNHPRNQCPQLSHFLNECLLVKRGLLVEELVFQLVSGEFKSSIHKIVSREMQHKNNIGIIPG